MTLVHYNGQIAAVVGASGFHLAPHLEGRPMGDPECCFVAFMAAHALDVRHGITAGPYSDQRGALFARYALIDDDAFRKIGTEPVEEVARRFNVPEAEIVAKRGDLAAFAKPFGAITDAAPPPPDDNQAGAR